MLPKVLPADKWASGSPFLLPPAPIPPIRPSLWGPSAPPLRLGQWPWEEPEHPGVILLGREGPPRPGKKAAADCRQRWTHVRWGQWSPRRQRFFLEGWWLGRERARLPSGSGLVLGKWVLLWGDQRLFQGQSGGYCGALWGGDFSSNGVSRTGLCGGRVLPGCRGRRPKRPPSQLQEPPPRRIFPGGPRMLFRSRRAARSSLLSHSPHTEA
ncbi:uncharacterized protein LOC120857787 [Oryx dammah]|uniref:uncharacterized protein LOC120857787 n=1 Tax=Oryx dammah TaxID=59534 RepID=UPI001A9B779B|nr:uncharacterized protein LOC120857787 [Oryx dammah]